MTRPKSTYVPTQEHLLRRESHLEAGANPGLQDGEYAERTRLPEEIPVAVAIHRPPQRGAGETSPGEGGIRKG